MTLRIHLCIMQPAGYVHSQGFLDQARYARHQFRRFGAEVSIGKNRLREDSVNIIFGAHLGFSADLKQRYACVFFNLEQLGDGGASVSADYINLLNRSPVIDYDDRNITAYGRSPVDVPVVSFQWAPYLASASNLPLKDRPIDLLFFGSINARRQAIFSRIEACGLSVSRFDHPLYAEERDHFIRQSKAVFNCHFYESSRFEQARAFHTLSLATPLISERTPKTLPHTAYEDVVTWLNDQNLETFFRKEFMSTAWQVRATKQLQAFTAKDPKIEWHVAYNFCRTLWNNATTVQGHQVWRPMAMRLGAGNHYRLGWLNVDMHEHSRPDLVLNLAQTIELPLETDTLGGGKVRIEANSLDRICANNVPARVSSLTDLMTNLLALLKEDGELEIEVPHEQASSTWQDPTHLRAMNKNSWLYYTTGFWSLGWFDHRFECVDFKWLDGKHEPCSETAALYMKVRLKKITTTAHERSIARTMHPDFGGVASDSFLATPSTELQ